MNTKTKISVIIPVYNRSELLKINLISLSKQTLNHENFEVIVVDDGSSEDLEKVVKEIKKISTINITYHKQKNQGPAVARNKGKELAKSSILALIDSDVYADPDWLKNGLKAILKSDTIGAVEGKTIIPNKEKISPFTHQMENLKGGTYPTCNYFIRKELCNFYPKYAMAFREDSDLAFALLSCGYKIEFEKSALAYHPTLPAKKSTPFYLAKRNQYDLMLKKRFPVLYKNKLDNHSMFGFSLSNLRKKIYLSFILSTISFMTVLLITLISQYKIVSFFQEYSQYLFPLSILLGLFSLVSFTAVYFVNSRNCNPKATGFFGYIMLVFISFSVPFIMYASIVKGWFLFRKTKPFNKNEFLNGYK